MPLTSGSMFGSYEILDSLGSGGMGEVYRARDLRLGREVAIKVLRDEYARDAQRLARFEREARAASALNHPAIVTIFDIGEAEGTPFIAMELIRGRTVRDLLRSGPLSAPVLMDVAVQTADGLAKAHEAGIIHRDLKPENLMVTEDGFVKILDFGLAKLVPRPFEVETEAATATRSPTRSGALIGTVEYMSPEQAASKPVDHRTDQFTLGLVVYEMAAGERAFSRATVPQTLAAIIEADAPSLAACRSDLPAALPEVVARCLAKDPRQRFASTRDLAQVLRDAKHGSTSALRSLAAPPVVEALARPREAGRVYYVQTEGRVRTMDERKLRRKLRQNEFSGLEMVRRDGEERWEVLCDSRVFAEEVPIRGSARNAARWRILRGFGGHLAGFIGVGFGMTLMSGHVPFWMAFWGIALISHAFKVLPALTGLVQEGQVRLPERLSSVTGRLLPSGGAEKQAPSREFAEEVERVRSLLRRRSKEERRALMPEIDRLVTSMAALSAKQADLEEQTSAREFERLRETEREAQAKLAATGSEYDRQLLGRQLAVIETRRRAIDAALVQLDRMRVRKSLVEHQLKQLRLDLSQAEARRLDSPELSSRILDIRREVDAFDEADEILAQR